jgi:hypothetical protein
MVRISKAKNAEKLAKAGISRRSWSKDEFCARNGISVGLYANLKKRGLGPDETEVLDRTLITVEAEDKWLRKNKRKVASAKAAIAKAEAEAEAEASAKAEAVEAGS